MSSVLFYLVGYPGAGKTTFAKQLAPELGYVHLHADKVGFELFGLPNFSPVQVRDTRNAMDHMAIADLKQGKTVIYDALISSVTDREHIVSIAKTLDKPAVGIWIQTPLYIARQRAGVLRISEFAENYFRIIPSRTFDKYLDSFEPPDLRENFIILSGEASFAEQFTSFQAQL